MMKVNNEKRKKCKLHKWNIFKNKENHNLKNDTLKFNQNQNQVDFFTCTQSNCNWTPEIEKANSRRV